MTLRVKLFITIFAALVPLGALQLWVNQSQTGMTELVRSFDEVSENTLLQLSTIRDLSFTLLNDSTSSLSGVNLQVFKQDQLKFDQALRTYEQVTKAFPGIHHARSEGITLSRNYRNELGNITFALENSAPKKLLRDSIGRLEEQQNKLVKWIDEVTNRYLVDMSERQAQANEASRVIARQFYLATAGVLLLAIALIWYQLQAVLIPCRRIESAAKELATGKKGVKIDLDTFGEAKDVIESFNSMSETLAETTISKDYMHKVLNSMADSLYVLDADHKIIFANNAATKLLCIELEALVGAPVTKICKNTPTHGATTIESRLLAKDAEEIPVLLSRAIIQGEEAPCYVWVATDLREKLRQENELREYRKKLAHNENLASLGAMSALVAHKLSQPLSSMRLFLQQSI